MCDDLRCCIRAAKREFASWPQWMKDAAYMAAAIPVDTSPTVDSVAAIATEAERAA